MKLTPLRTHTLYDLPDFQQRMFSIIVLPLPLPSIICVGITYIRNISCVYCFLSEPTCTRMDPHAQHACMCTCISSPRLTHTPISWQHTGDDVWTWIYAADVFTQVVFRSHGGDLYVFKPNVSTHDKNDVATFFLISVRRPMR